MQFLKSQYPFFFKSQSSQVFTLKDAACIIHSVFPCVYMSVRSSVLLSVPLPIRLSIYLSVHRCVCLYVCSSARPFISLQSLYHIKDLYSISPTYSLQIRKTSIYWKNAQYRHS